jgi:transposase
MAIPLPDARLLSDEVLEALRLRALRGCELGFTEADVADLLGVTRETVSRWWSAYAHGGTTALPQARTGRPLGSGRLLSDAQAQRIQQLLDHHSPEDLGIPAPLRHHRHQDPEEVRQWLEETYPAIERRAAQEGATIFWGDEVGVAADAHPGYGYAREGQAATVEVPEPHIRVNQIAAVSNRGQVRFMTYTGTMDAVLFLVFLRRFLRSTVGKVFLIVDRLKAHEDGQVTAWLARHRDRLELFYLPRRAPERNPEEYLNNDLKGQVNAEGLPETKEDLRSRMLRFMRRLVHLPEHVMNYFQHPCVQYAAGLTDNV